MNDYYFSFLFRRESSFLKNMEKFTKMRKQGHSKKISMKMKRKRKMLPAN